MHRCIVSLHKTTKYIIRSHMFVCFSYFFDSHSAGSCELAYYKAPRPTVSAKHLLTVLLNNNNYRNKNHLHCTSWMTRILTANFHFWMNFPDCIHQTRHCYTVFLKHKEQKDVLHMIAWFTCFVHVCMYVLIKDQMVIFF